ncbi:unnamed protein product [Darwinula stevensoni]|uniref:Intimal thickness related receptor IRP domain-containing protein n=1 Tax=Darwinula stevensoni TaxID=69355 RepID=A0A7R8X3P5_9CRUS|nr:unnamed protein product [Darwinula stevensoni]CAG0884590.1 unnamed protein product [Darwinula stevensoni]
MFDVHVGKQILIAKDGARCHFGLTKGKDIDVHVNLSLKFVCEFNGGTSDANMATPPPLTYSLSLFLIFSLHRCVFGKYIEGTLRTYENWAFLTRFCFLSEDGKFEFEIEYPLEYAVESLLLYYDSPDQWPAVYKSGKNCTEMLKPLKVENFQFVNLTSLDDLSGCQVVREQNDQAYYRCKEMRSFRSARERWWFIAIANCESQKGLFLDYKIKMTNGLPGDFWHEHFSADEFYILRVDIIFFALNVLLCFFAFLEAVELKARQLLHVTYKLFVTSLILQCVGVLFLVLAYARYGVDGVGWPGIKLTGELLESCSEIIFVLMLLLVAKGYTITRGRLRQGSSVKLTLFMCAYCLAYATLFIYQQQNFDPGEVLYLYESPPGYGIVSLRLIAWVSFGYSVFFTLKHYPEKNSFYLSLLVFFTLWFVAGPMVILLAAYVIPDWIREKTVNAVELSVTFLGHMVFLILTRPSAANDNFPYHVRTTQIGIMENSYNGTIGNNHLDAFGHHPYAPSAPLADETSQTVPNQTPGPPQPYRRTPAEIFTVATSAEMTRMGRLPPLKPAGKNDNSFPHHAPGEPRQLLQE